MSQEVTRTVTVGNPQGLHLRPAQKIADLAGKFEASVTLSNGKETVDAKSILNIVTLAAVQGAELLLTTSGADAEEAMAALVAYLEASHEEGEPAAE